MLMRDLKNLTDRTPSITPQAIADNTNSDGHIAGSVVDRVNHGGVLLEVEYGGMDSDVTGGVLKLIPMHGDAANGSDQAQVGSDEVDYNFGAVADKGVLRYLYTGIKRYVSTKVVNALTGGASHNKVNIAASVLASERRFDGAQPAVSSDPSMTN